MNKDNDIIVRALNGQKHMFTYHIEGQYRFMYYLIHEKECFIIFKTRGAAERFTMIKHDCSSVLNDFKYAAL